MATADDDELFDDEREDVDRPMARLFTEYGRRFPVPMLLALGANMVSPLMGLAPAYLLSVAIDALFTRETPLELPLIPARYVPAAIEDQLLFVFGLMILVYTLNAVTTWIGSWGWANFAENVQHDLRTDVYDTMQRLGMEFFSDKQTGELMSILTSDVNRLEGFLNGWLGRILNILVQVVGITVVMMTINWELALVALLPTPLLTLISYLFVRKVRPKYRESRSTFGDLASRLENNLSGIEVVKAFTTEPFESERVADASSEHKAARWGARRWGVRFGPGLTIVSGYGFAVVFLVGGWWLMFGPPASFFSSTITVGTVVLFLQYTRQIQGPMTQAGQLLNNYERVKASAERVFVLMDHPVDIPERDGAVELEDVDGQIEFEDVSFRYPDGEQALAGIDFEVEPGQMIGLVGPTGSGKSTLMKLLMRLYDVGEPSDSEGSSVERKGSDGVRANGVREDSSQWERRDRAEGGAVRIDGVDVRECTLRSLRRSIGFVSQEPFLFSGTIRENLAYGPDTYSDEEIVEAAKRANAHEFIVALEDGYDSEVGQRGDQLSGGQRQRIAIARAILKDPPVLVLDEATSHVDNETEALIQQSLEDIIADRTTFAIAHRLSTVRNADRLMVLEDGDIVERGTHEELLAMGGLYSNLWHVQVGEVESLPQSFLEESIDRRS